jgi:hypothetical protein
MLVASRDPFHPGAHEVSSSPSRAAAPRFMHAMSVLQIVGTLLAIPVGLGSAYTMYRANFSIETNCQNLRANIVAMLDKSVDASTRHMLARRDVEAFENACRTVDPDATAAFKALLAADKPATPVAIARPAEARAEPMTRKTEAHPAVIAKQTPAVPPAVKAEAPAVQRDAASDAVWIAAVRLALVNHTVEPKPAMEQIKAAAVAPAPPVEPAKPATVTLMPPAASPIAQEIRPTAETQASAMTLAAPPPASPAMPLAIVPVPQADDGHPVPPASIPEATSTPAKTDEHTRSRLGELAAKIPLVGWAINR